jgi:hypothetical protein
MFALETVPLRRVVEARNINDVKPVLDVEAQCMKLRM